VLSNLVAGPGKPSPLPAGWILRFSSLTGSTNDDALVAARAGCPDRSAFLANGQRAGRGRNGRAWIAPVGSSILCSLVLRTRLAPALVTAATALAVAESIRDVVGLEARIKWPNDVMLADRKVCGILTEVTRGPGLPAVVVGFGLNVNLDPGTLGSLNSATSLSAEIGTRISRGPLLFAILRGVDDTLTSAEKRGTHDLLERWEKLLWRRYQSVSVGDNDQRIMGVVEGVTQSGTLRLRLSDGSRAEVVAGDVGVPDGAEIHSACGSMACGEAPRELAGPPRGPGWDPERPARPARSAPARRPQ